MPQTFYEVLWIFMIYAFIGWCTEVAYAALETGKFVNRGFFNGPYCPIYGCGVLVVVVILTPLKDNLLLLFLGSFLLTSVLEFITGYILEKVFKNKWWDYSEFPFNIMGYICLKFSVLWGLGCTFIMRILHPIIFRFIRIIPKIPGIVLISVLMSAFAADCIVSFMIVLKFNRRLKVMDEIAGKLKVISNEIGENIYENVSEAMEKRDAMQEAKKAEYEELKRKYRELSSRKIYGHDRLIKAFPGMKSRDYNESLVKLKEHVKKIVRKEQEMEG